MASDFTTTQWSQVLAARDGAGTEAAEAFAFLCERYWFPLFSFVRRQGSGPDEAADLTQAFFCYLLEKDVIHAVEPTAGRFRSFLLASLRHFLSHEREKERAQKRGGRTGTLSFDTAAAEARYGLEPVDQRTPEEVFEHRWALTVLERALARLREEGENGDGRRFDRLEPLLIGQRPAPAQAELAAELDMTEGAVRSALYRLRRRLGELIRSEIADTVSDPADVDDEVRHLLGALAPPEARPGR